MEKRTSWFIERIERMGNKSLEDRVTAALNSTALTNILLGCALILFSLMVVPRTIIAVIIIAAVIVLYRRYQK